MKKQGLTIEFVRNSPEFSLVKELRFNGILEFVLENIRLKNSCTFFYFLFNLLYLSVLIALSIFGFMDDIITFKTYMVWLGWGILAGSILIIPFHEGFHALAFLAIGARKIRFGADLRQMIFYATAENFVAGQKGFTLVALAPFIFINLISLTFAFFGGFEVRLMIISLLLLHNIMCIGDFAMLSFFRENREKEMYTFDDLDTKTAWFYERKS